jgi:hypothetical protein
MGRIHRKYCLGTAYRFTSILTQNKHSKSKQKIKHTTLFHIFVVWQNCFSIILILLMYRTNTSLQGKGKIVPMHNWGAHYEGVWMSGVTGSSFFVSELDEGESSAWRPGSFIPKETTPGPIKFISITSWSRICDILYLVCRCIHNFRTKFRLPDSNVSFIFRQGNSLLKG